MKNYKTLNIVQGILDIIMSLAFAFAAFYFFVFGVLISTVNNVGIIVTIMSIIHVILAILNFIIAIFSFYFSKEFKTQNIKSHLSFAILISILFLILITLLLVVEASFVLILLFCIYLIPIVLHWIIFIMSIKLNKNLNSEINSINF